MSQIVKKFPVLGSSQDPEQLSMTVKGVLVALIPIIVMVAKPFAPDLVESDLVESINALSAVVAAVLLAWGIIRKVVTKFRK